MATWFDVLILGGPGATVSNFLILLETFLFWFILFWFILFQSEDNAFEENVAKDSASQGVRVEQEEKERKRINYDDWSWMSVSQNKKERRQETKITFEYVLT